MKTQTDKTQETQSESVANTISQQQSGSKTTTPFKDNRAKTVTQRKLQETADNSPQTKQAAQLQATADNYSAQQPIQKKGNKSKKEGPEPRNVKMGPILEHDPVQSQDGVQEYLARIAPRDGPIRDYIDEHADQNGGLCAGWVVLHRNNPDQLIDLWEKVGTKIENEDRSDLGVRDTSKAVEMYMQAQHHFANDEANRDNFTGPDRETLDEANVTSDLPETDQNKKSSRKVSGIKPGTIYDTGYEIMSSGKYSKKSVFVEIYGYGHTAQMQFAAGKLQSICETEYAGVVKCTEPDKAEQMLTNSFFTMMRANLDDPDAEISDVTFTLNFDIHVY